MMAKDGFFEGLDFEGEKKSAEERRQEFLERREEEIERDDQIVRRKNGVAAVHRVIGIITVVIAVFCILGGIFMLVDASMRYRYDASGGWVIVMRVAGLFSALMYFAVAEIIQILHDIRAEVYMGKGRRK